MGRLRTHVRAQEPDPALLAPKDPRGRTGRLPRGLRRAAARARRVRRVGPLRRDRAARGPPRTVLRHGGEAQRGGPARARAPRRAVPHVALHEAQRGREALQLPPVHDHPARAVRRQGRRQDRRRRVRGPGAGRAAPEGRRLRRRLGLLSRARDAATEPPAPPRPRRGGGGLGGRAAVRRAPRPPPSPPGSLPPPASAETKVPDDGPEEAAEGAAPPSARVAPPPPAAPATTKAGHTLRARADAQRSRLREQGWSVVAKERTVRGRVQYSYFYYAPVDRKRFTSLKRAMQHVRETSAASHPPSAMPPV